MNKLSLVFGAAAKDMLRAYRSATAVVFMFGIPLLFTGMFSLMFGGGEEGPSFNLPVTKVVVANLDQGSEQLRQNLDAFAGMGESSDQGLDLSSIDSLGGFLFLTLQHEELANLVDASQSPDADSARKAVDQEEANIAIIVPENFSEVLVNPGLRTEIELYYDPTLTLGPEIISSIVKGFVDQSMQVTLGLQVILDQFEQAGLTTSEEQFNMIITGLITPSSMPATEITAVDPNQDQNQPTKRNPIAGMLSLIMGGMTIFYGYFTGTNLVMTLLEEAESGTLARIFTTPAPPWAILSGKFLASGLMVLVQVSVLMFLGKFIFQFDWGMLSSIILFIITLVISAASFGVFFISFTKNTKQGSAIFGGVLTISGMVGIFSVFVMNAPGAAQFADTLPLVVPQGWAMAILRRTIDGASPGELIPYLLGIIAWSAVFSVFGVLRFRRRFG